MAARNRVTTCRRGVALLALIVVAQALLPLLVNGAAAKDRGLAYSVGLAGLIDPTSLGELERAIDDARRQDAEVFILRLDTPGGDERTMREMVKVIAAAPMPVIVYVHPSGARADSAGLVLTLAGDVAAMAPQTNIGSSTPVWGGPPPRSKSEDQLLQDLRRKVINSGVAFARALAEDHRRNADLAERMVRQSVNVSATRARQARLVDVLAPSEQALLRALDGFAVKGRKAQRLQTADLEVKHFEEGLLDSGGNDFGDTSFAGSFLRTLIYVLMAAIAIGVALTASGRGRRSWRRWRRRRRRLKLQRR